VRWAIRDDRPYRDLIEHYKRLSEFRAYDRHPEVTPKPCNVRVGDNTLGT